MFRPFRLRVWGITALLSSALALAGASLLTAQPPSAGAAPQITLTRAAGDSSTDVRTRARSKLLQGRAHLGQGNFEQAEAIAAEVAALELSYVASEDTPAKLYDDVKKAKHDPKALLQAARAALARKDYDRAEKYARAAEQKAGTFTFPIWGDSPTKVLDEIQVVRKSTRPTSSQAAPTANLKKEAPKSGIVQTSHVEQAPKPADAAVRTQAKNRLTQGRTHLGLGNFDSAEKVAQEVAALKVTYSGGDDTPTKLLQDVQKGKSDPKLLMLAAKSAMSRKDYDQAEQYAKLADRNAGTFSFPVWSESPSDLLKQIEAARKPLVKKDAPKAPPVAKAKEKEAPKSGIVKASHTEPVAKQDTAAVAARAQAKKRLAQGRTHLGMGDFPGAEKIANEVGALKLTYSGGDDTPTKLLQDVQKGKSDPKLLMLAAKSAMSRKDYDQAEQYAKLADRNAGTFSFPIWAESPSDLLKEIEAARKPLVKKDAPKAPPVAKQPEKAVVKKDVPKAMVENKEVVKTQPKAQPSSTGNTDDKARGLIKQARAALQQGKFAEAKTLTAQARDLKPNLNWWEDNPSRLTDDLQRAENARPRTEVAKNSTPTTSAPGEMPRTRDAARTMLVKGREHLNAGKLDEAFATAQNVKAARSIEWGLFEDSPDRLLIDVDKARTKRDREEADRLLVQGRKLLEKGDHEGAARLAYRAQKLNSSYSIWDLGDRPSKLLADCQTAQARNRKTELPPAIVRKDDRPPAPVQSPEPKRTEVAVNEAPPAPKQDIQPVTNVVPQQQQKPETLLVSNVPPAPPPPPQPPPGATVPDVPPQRPIPSESPSKGQAQQLVAESQRLLREGKLFEARQKAVEAQRLNALFAIDEISPELVYQQVATEARSRVDSLVRQAHEEALFGQGAVAARHQNAEGRLAEARQLAASFGHDVRVIDDKVAELRRHRDAAMTQQTAAPSNAVVKLTPAAPAAPVQQPVNQGRLLLDNARRELSKGETKMARTMCEEVIKGRFGMQEEAVALLRSIDAEEFNQKALAANRTFDAAHRAFNRNDKAQASAMIAAIDTRLLHPENQQRLREMALTPEMYSPPAVGRATVSDKGAPKMEALPVPPTGRLMRGGEDGLPGAPPGGTRLVSGEGKATATDKGGDVLDGYKQRMQILAQQLRREGIDAQNTAADRLRAGDHDGAIEILTGYLATLEQQKMEPGQFTQLRRPIDARISQYRLLREQRRLTAERNAPRINGMAEVRERQNAEELKKKNVEKLMREYNTLYREGKYPEASALAMRAHELDPDNPIVTSAILLARRRDALQDSKDIKASREDWTLRSLNDVERYPGANVIDNGIDLPRDAALRSQKRNKDGKGGPIGRKTEREKDIERRLSSPVRINFENAPLKQVLDDLRDAHSINIVPDLPALQEAGVSLDSPVTIKLDQVSLKSALNLILHQVKLTHVIKDEVLNVTTEENAKGKLVAATYPVADLVIPVENFGDLQAHSANQANQVREVHGGVNVNGGVNPYSPTPIPGRLGLLRGQPVGQPNNYPSGPEAGPPSPFGNNGQPTTVKSRVTNTMESQLIRLITNSVNPHSWSDNGGPGTIEYYPLTLALVVNQTPDIQEQIQDLLAALRRLQDQEVAIEVRFITVSEDFFERIGVNFNVNILTDPITRKFEPALVNNAFVQDPNNFINNINFGRFLSGAGPGGTLTPTLDIPITNNSFFNTFPSYGRYIPGGGLALGLAFLSDIQVFLFLEAVQGDVRSNLMQAPKLTMFNGQTATISANSFQSLITNVLVIPNGDGTFLFQPQVQSFPTGIQLTLQPAISADRRFVRVSLTPNFNALKRDQIQAVPISVPIFTNADGQGGGGQPVLITQFIQTPNVVSLSVNTTVVVPDGGTVLMGGLKQLSEERSEYGPPILSKIPYVNRLFKNVGYGRASDSLLIMVTPRIIIQEEEEERATGFRTTPFIQN